MNLFPLTGQIYMTVAFYQVANMLINVNQLVVSGCNNDESLPQNDDASDLYFHLLCLNFH
jgi:hypothetical protein